MKMKKVCNNERCSFIGTTKEKLQMPICISVHSRYFHTRSVTAINLHETASYGCGDTHGVRRFIENEIRGSPIFNFFTF